MLRSGAISPPVLEATNNLYAFHQQGSGSTVSIQTPLKNLVGGEIDWTLTESIAAVTPAATSGTFVTQTTIDLTINTTGLAANQWHNLGTITVSGTANGSPVAGNPQTITINLYKGDVSFIYLPTVTK
jgi:hypothetical protein